MCNKQKPTYCCCKCRELTPELYWFCEQDTESKSCEETVSKFFESSEEEEHE